MFKKIVVPIDGSEASKRALSTALGIAKRFDSEVTVITVAGFQSEPTVMEDFPVHQEGSNAMDPRDAFDLLAQAEERHHIELLKEAEKESKAEGLDVRTELLRGKPAEEIIEFLDDEVHDLVVMGSRGLGGMKRLLLGSTSTAVLHHCNHSVLIVK
jgi:nucleotide-binding universal stress UspA family protein